MKKEKLKMACCIMKRKLILPGITLTMCSIFRFDKIQSLNVYTEVVKAAFTLAVVKGIV